MTALYLHEDAKELLAGKTLVVIGDSVERSVYKDLVCLLQENRYLTDQELRKKGELSFFGDELVYGGVKGEQKNSINYRECRYFKTEFEACCRYYFVTICYGDYVEEILQELSLEPTDIIVMNSCLWDVHRHGRKGIENYEENLEKLVLSLRRLMPDCIFLWLTTPPVAVQSKGGFLSNPGNENVKIQEVKYCNEIAREVFSAADNIYGTFKVVDLDYVFQYFEHHRASDGVHWNERAHRRMSNMILEEISKYYNMKVPRILDDHGIRPEREYFPPMVRNAWVDDDRSDFWSNERVPGQNGWDFEDSQRGIPRMRLPVQGYPFIPRNIPRPIKFGPPGAPGPSFDPRLRMPIMNDLDDLGHARQQVESQLVESRKRKRNSVGDNTDRPPEKQYRFGVQSMNASVASSKRKAEESNSEPVKKMKIEEVDGKLKKLVDLGDGVTIHLPLNEKEKQEYHKTQAKKEEKAKADKLAEEKKAIAMKKKAEDDLKKKGKPETKSVQREKGVADTEWIVKDEVVISEEEKKAALKDAEEKGRKDKEKEEQWIIKDEVIGTDEEEKSAEEKTKTDDQKETESKEVTAKPRKVFMTRQRKNMEKAPIEEVEDEKTTEENEDISDKHVVSSNAADVATVAGDEKEPVELAKVSDDAKVIPLEEAMKNVSELPLVSSVPENVDEKEKEKLQRKVLVPTRRSSRLSKSASKLLNLIKTPVQELLGKVQPTLNEKKSKANTKLPAVDKNVVNASEDTVATVGQVVEETNTPKTVEIDNGEKNGIPSVDTEKAITTSVDTEKIISSVETEKATYTKTNTSLVTDASIVTVSSSTAMISNSTNNLDVSSLDTMSANVLKNCVLTSFDQAVSVPKEEKTPFLKEIVSVPETAQTQSPKQVVTSTQKPEVVPVTTAEVPLAANKATISSSLKQEVISTPKPSELKPSSKVTVAQDEKPAVQQVKTSAPQKQVMETYKDVVSQNNSTVESTSDKKSPVVIQTITTTISVENKKAPIIPTTTRVSLLPPPFTRGIDSSIKNRLPSMLKPPLLNLYDSKPSLISNTISVVKTITCTVNSTTSSLGPLIGKGSTQSKASDLRNTNPETVTKVVATQNSKSLVAPPVSTKPGLSSTPSISMSGNTKVCSVSSVTTRTIIDSRIVTSLSSTTASGESSLNTLATDQTNVSPKKVNTLALLSMPSPFAKPKTRQPVSSAPKLPSVFDQAPPTSKYPATVVSTSNTHNAPLQVAKPVGVSKVSTSTPPVLSHIKGVNQPGKSISPVVRKDTVSSDVKDEKFSNKIKGKENNSYKGIPNSFAHSHSRDSIQSKKEIKPVSKMAKEIINNKSPHNAIEKHAFNQLPYNTSKETNKVGEGQRKLNSVTKEEKNSFPKPTDNGPSVLRSKSISEDLNEDLLLSEADVTDDLSDLDESILEDTSNTFTAGHTLNNYKWTPNQTNEHKVITTSAFQKCPVKVSNNSKSQGNFVNQQTHFSGTTYSASTSTVGTNSFSKYPIGSSTTVVESNTSNQVTSSCIPINSTDKTTPVKEKKKPKKFPNETKEEKRARRALKREKKERRLKEKEEKKKLLANATVAPDNVVENNYDWGDVLLQNNSQAPISQPQQRVRSATWHPSYYPTYDKNSKRSAELHERLAPPNSVPQQSYQQQYQNQVGTKSQVPNHLTQQQQQQQQPHQQQLQQQQRPQQRPQQQQQQQKQQQQQQQQLQQQQQQQKQQHFNTTGVPYSPQRVQNPVNQVPTSSPMMGHTNQQNPATARNRKVQHGLSNHPVPNQSLQSYSNPPSQRIQNSTSEISGTAQFPVPVPSDSTSYNQQASVLQVAPQPVSGQPQANVVHPELPKQKLALNPSQSHQQNIVYPAQQPVPSQPISNQPVQQRLPNIVPSDQPQIVLPAASRVSYQQPTLTVSRSNGELNQSRQQNLLPTQKRTVPPPGQRIHTVNTSISKPNQHQTEPLQAIQTISKSTTQKHLNQKTGHMGQHAYSPYQQALHPHVYQQPQHLIQQQHSAVIAQQHLNSQQLLQQQQQQQQLQQQHAAAQSAGHKQLYIDEYGQTYTLEEETYIVDPSGQIQNISSATNSYMQQQQMQQQGVQLPQQGVQQQYAIQSSLLYSHQQQPGYL